MADEQGRNRVELEYGARVDRASQEQAKAESVRAAEDTARAVSQVAQKPQTVANAEAASRAAAAREAQAAAAGKAAEAEKRLRDEQDRLYSSISKANDRALELENSFRRLGSSRFGEQVNRQASIGEGMVNRLRQNVINLRQILEDPASQDPKLIARIAPLADAAEKRLAVLERRLKSLGAEAQQARGAGGGGAADPFDLGAAARRAAGGGGGDDDDGGGGGRRGIPGLSSAFGYATARLRIPGAGGLGTLTGALGVGGAAGYVAAGGATVALLAAIVRESNELERSNFNLRASSIAAGEGFLEARADAESFHEALGVTHDEANQLGAALAQLRLRAGDALPATAARDLSTLARAQGLEPEEAAAQIQGLAKGSAEAFERLTGSRADITLDRYARSIGTTTARLTDMQKVQVLTNAALEQAAKLQGLAADRTDALSQKTTSFFNGIKDKVGEYSSSFVQRYVYLETGEETYKRLMREAGLDGSGGKAAVAEAEARQARKEQEAEANRQQAARIAQEKRFEDEARAARALPESYGRGLTPVGQSQADLARLRARREAVQTAFEEFQKRESEFSTDDFKAFSDQFKDQLQGLTDEIRNQVGAAAGEARGHVQALARDIQSSTEEFTRLRLPGDAANPYVKIFSDGERALESFRQRFALLSQEQRDQFARQLEAQQQAAVYNQRVSDTMSRVRLEFEAAELERPFEELTGAMKRTLQVFEAGLKVATANPALRANAELVEARSQFRFGFTGNDRLLRERGLQLDAEGNLSLSSDAIARKEFDQLLQLRARFGGAPGLAGEQIRNRINEQIGQVYGRLSPAALRGVASDPFLSQTFAGSFREQAAYNESQLRRAARIAELGAPSLRLAEQQLQALSETAGADDPANRNRTRAEFLAITGAIPREELTPELLAGRVTALREEASFKAESEQRAAEAFKETRDFQRALIGEGGEGGKLNDILAAIRDRSERVIVEVNNRSERATVSTLGGGFQ